ncbi:hypothetical protein [Dysgonomonas sp.]|jgi:hypothetical protein|nr:hypothetical protein [Prevotella sp.]
MKKILILISLILFCLLSYAQKGEYAVRYPDDYLIIDSIRKIYSSDDYKLLVYQTGYNNRCVSSVVMIQVKDKIKFWSILYQDTNETGYSCPVKIQEEGYIEDSSVFSYPAYKKTGITKKEDISDKLVFSPPSRESEMIFYIDNHISFYLEDDTDIGLGYISDKSKEKYRQKWTQIIRKELIPIIEKYCK